MGTNLRKKAGFDEISRNTANLFRTALLCLLLSTASLSAQHLNWAAQDSLSDNGFHFGMGVCHDGADNIYTSSIYRPSSGYLTPWGSYISKRDEAGNLLWRKFYYRIEAWSVDSDPAGNLYVTGVFCKQGNLGCGIMEDSAGFRTFFIAKLDNLGNCLWSKMVKNAVGTRVIYSAIDNSIYSIGNYHNVGVQFDSVTISSPGGQFLAKYTSDGSLIWLIPISNEKHICNIALNNSYVAITGTYAFDLYFGADSTLATLGLPNAVSDEIHNVYTAMFDHAGNLQWAKTTVVAKWDATSNSIAIDDQNNVYVTGEHNDSALIAGRMFFSSTFSRDAFIVKYNEAGDTVKVVSFDGNGPFEGRAIHATSSGIYFAGGAAGQISMADTIVTPPSSSIILAKLNLDLDHVEWLRMYSSPGGDHNEIFKITSDNDGRIIACGDYTTSLQVDDQLLYYGRMHYKKPFVLSLSETSTGIQSSELTSTLTISPNPSSGIIQISYKSQVGIMQSFIEIRNANGQILRSIKGPSGSRSFDQMIDLSQYPRGIYLVEVTADGKRSSRKIVLQ
jgi:hypothetical protein